MPTKEQLEIMLAEAQAQIEQLQKEKTVSVVGLPKDYVFREYPKCLYHPDRGLETRIVDGPPAEEAAKADGFTLDKPAHETCPAAK